MGCGESRDIQYQEVDLSAPMSVSFDFHGLTVKECKEFVNVALQNRNLHFGRDPVNSYLFITGKGIHSQGEAKLKPMVLETCQSKGFQASVMPQNEGIIQVKL